MSVATVFLAALVTALATGLGALPLLLGRRAEGLLGLGTALAGGFMLGASAGLIGEGAGSDAVGTAVGAILGAVFILVTRHLLRHDHHFAFGVIRGRDAVSALMIVGVMTIHSFTEGIGVGVSFGDGAALGVVIATAIAVHNIPEGLAISLVLVPRGVSVARAAAWSVFSSLPQPLMAVPAYLLVEWFEPLLAPGLGFAAGAMIWMVAVQLLPDALRSSSPASVAVVTGAAAVAMVGLQVVLLG